MRNRALSACVLMVALLVGAAPARAEEKAVWQTAGFWKAAGGAAAGGWAGAKLLGWAPMLAGFSQIAKVSPFAALVARPLVPVLAGAVGAQFASKGLKKADWAMVAAQTVGGALGTAAALFAIPGAGAMGPWIGEAIGWYGGSWLLKRWRKKLEGKAASVVAVPEIRCGTPAAVAYERWRSAKEAREARQAYAGVVQVIAR